MGYAASGDARCLGRWTLLWDMLLVRGDEGVESLRSGAAARWGIQWCCGAREQAADAFRPDIEGSMSIGLVYRATKFSSRIKAQKSPHSEFVLLAKWTDRDCAVWLDAAPDVCYKGESG